MGSRCCSDFAMVSRFVERLMWCPRCTTRLIVSLRSHRIRLIGQLVRPVLHHLRQRSDAAELTRRNALVACPGFSLLLDVRRPDYGPRSRSCTLGAVWHPVDLAQPDHRAAWGQPSSEPVCAWSGSAPGLACGSPPGGRGDATPRPPDPVAAVLVAGHPGELPARRGHFLVWCRLYQRVEYRCAKERTVTRRELGSVPIHGQ
jgi:hypothetical protein